MVFEQGIESLEVYFLGTDDTRENEVFLLDILGEAPFLYTTLSFISPSSAVLEHNREFNEYEIRLY